MTKRYLRLTCTNCKREVDKLVDLTHYAPDQCTITLGCEGRLQPVEYRSSGGIAVAPEIGVKDWRPRGPAAYATGALSVTTEQALVQLETGTLKQLVLAIYSPTEPASAAQHTLPMSITADAPKAYRQYIFRKEGSFTTISGIESGLEKKALRFVATGSNPDQVEVYVNGVKREQGAGAEDYQIYTSDVSAAPPNTILFNALLDSTGNTQVDVIVSKLALASSINLTFKRNKSDESRTSTGAWENISYVDKLEGDVWKRYYLFTLDLDDASIPLNSTVVPLVSDAFFLLARQPYSQVDRYSNVAVLLSELSAERNFIKYFTEDGETTMRVTATAISTFFPLLRFGKFTVEKTLKAASLGAVEQLVVDGKIIIGPDA